MMTEDKKKKKNIIIVDVTVANCQIRAEKPLDIYQNMPMPNTDVERVIWFESGMLPTNRLNNRVFGCLKGNQRG